MLPSGVDRQCAGHGPEGLTCLVQSQVGPVALLAEVQQDQMTDRSRRRSVEHGGYQFRTLFVGEMSLVAEVVAIRSAGRREVRCNSTS